MSMSNKFARCLMGVSLAAALLVPVAVAAATTTYTLSGDYTRTRLDATDGTQRSQLSTPVPISGTAEIDTITGELAAGSIVLADYTETLYFAIPFPVPTDYAKIDYATETQILASVTGVVSADSFGPLITYAGSNQWFASSVSGTRSCSDSLGENGDAACATANASPSPEAWSAFDVELGFTADLSSFQSMTTLTWTDETPSEFTYHELNLFGVAVPEPGRGLMLGVSLLSLAALRRLS